MHGGTNPGAPKGNHNAWKHGGHSTEMSLAQNFLKMVAQKL